ncbi:MAG TPA: V-type ATP synthase subunit A [Clostridiales bacterium]|uniref:V-type ATP synthase alpha chain n=1 Tax=Candidatus Egerieisoma faecipullorum TaxID=2840963 RepID=A0A9D1LB04_9CLOT|nr:V-type ATP synthase subunit A [Clostridiales bacterium]HIU29768.1 V-type ATP synthase subunit A [Candidatus Egerieisoma faecipullorum]
MKYISRINGSVVKAKGNDDFSVQDMVYVGTIRLVGEVISVDGDEATVQVYESTSGLKPGEPVETTGEPLSVYLAPGIIGNMFDGIQRPLEKLYETSGDFITRGQQMENLDTQKKWHFIPVLQEGAQVGALSVFGEIPETGSVRHKAMIPLPLSGAASAADGVLEYIAPEGEYTITDCIAKVRAENGELREIRMLSRWPVRIPRPYKKRISADEPLITGQRVIDTLFPLARGGTAAIPGSFGTGKTMTQHQLAQWCDADIIVYIGCGERGNEMTEVLEDFPGLKDPRNGRSLMERTVLIANTSNMPVAAREASIYTGITLAEYYRDMGYDVAIMADSTSRWAEALREISGRLEEMPAEEGFPAYLPSRLSEFYGRAGRIVSYNDAKGSVSIIGAVSPQGGDFSEPVTQNTKRFVRCFWGLDRELAYARHYPAINWLTSYSEYIDDMTKWYNEKLGSDFLEMRAKMIKLLQEENDLMEIVKLVGADLMPEDQKLILEIGRVIRAGFLQQNAFHEVDTFVPLEKQYAMMSLILFLYERCVELTRMGVPVSVIKDTKFFDDCISMKYTVGNKDFSQIDRLREKFDKGIRELQRAYRDIKKPEQ